MTRPIKYKLWALPALLVLSMVLVWTEAVAETDYVCGSSLKKRTYYVNVKQHWGMGMPVGRVCVWFDDDKGDTTRYDARISFRADGETCQEGTSSCREFRMKQPLHAAYCDEDWEQSGAQACQELDEAVWLDRWKEDDGTPCLPGVEGVEPICGDANP